MGGRSPGGLWGRSGGGCWTRRGWGTCGSARASRGRAAGGRAPWGCGVEGRMPLASVGVRVLFVGCSWGALGNIDSFQQQPCIL